MTRYRFEHRATREPYPSQPVDGFASATEANLYAWDHMVPLTYVVHPFTPTEGTTP